MKRQRRHHLPEEVYDGNNHVVYLTTCTANHGRWLREPDLAAIARDEILMLHGAYPVIGYCIMPDHIHMLLGNAGSKLGSIMNRFKGRTSRRVRGVRRGLEVWQAGYWDHIVRREEGLYKVLQYILLNPVRAELVDDWWDYPWLGAPLLGDVGPDLFDVLSPEDLVWRELLADE
ncbi:MAG: transposase [Acidobacteria bacterium]|nr:transposase [Acidobacteriota bacterium]